MQVGAALEALIAGLRGHVMSTADWRPVIALANRTLLTPALFSALAQSGEIHRLPDDCASTWNSFTIATLNAMRACVRNSWKPSLP